MNKIMQEHLVLQVSTDGKKWDGSKYHDFVCRLCAGREYQKNAIFSALQFLLGGKYKNLRELANENFHHSEKMREHYGTFEELESCLQLPDILSGSLDLATGTGKSYVLYGIATIMLAEEAVSRVLVLCPSRTIESGLIDKFRSLARCRNLSNSMHAAKYYPPRIMNANSTVVEGSICIENYHAVLKHVKSSIPDSFAGKGADSLVLNDEAHHVASKNSDLKKWKNFLMDPKYQFSRVIGVSGTCYVDNTYFADVINRYSLRQAIEEKFVKNIEYTAEAPRMQDTEERWQVIHKIHKKNKRDLEPLGIRPLSIIVTAKIDRCEEIASELKTFLQEQESLPPDQAKARVLVVTSDSMHEKNLQALKNVDSKESKVEWIVSVSMLNEGWDVKNVFQIVPHEERAFHSKLLIAQVLGRGLRIPEKLKNEHPKVTVFNHDAWHGRIKNLVHEILEFDRRVQSLVIPNSLYHFNLHNLHYSSMPDVKEYPMTGKYKLFEKGYIEVPLAYAEENIRIVFVDVRDNQRSQEETIEHKTYTAREIARYMWRRLREIDGKMEEGGGKKMKTDYAKKYPASFLENLIVKSVERVKIPRDKIVEKVRQSILASLNVVMRPESKRVTYTPRANGIYPISTNKRGSISCSEADLMGNKKAIFYHSGSDKKMPKEERIFFASITAPDSNHQKRVKKIDNIFHFKSPVNMVIVDSDPERRFADILCEEKNSKKISAWIKNTDSGFYGIEYAWRSGKHTLRGKFNPDFFIKMNDGAILVVEIKGNSELEHPDQQNVRKFEFAKSHFEELNKWLKEEEEIRYQFYMLTPCCYGRFFQCMRDGTLDTFVSELGNAINNVIGNEKNGNNNE